MTIKAHNCENCGEYVGTFDHDRYLDGPVVCNSRECVQWERDEARAARERAQEEAVLDDFGRYR